MAQESYVQNLYGSKMLGDLSVVMIVADIGASGAVTLAAAESSPNVTITLDGTGLYSITFPQCQTVFVGSSETLLAAGTGSDIQFTAVSASAGTGAFETSITPGTAAEPASGTRFYIQLLCGAN